MSNPINNPEISLDQKKLIEELGLSSLSEEKQSEVLEKITEAALKRVFVEILGKLAEEDQEAYMQMVDKGGSPEEIDAFLKDKISGYDEFVQKTLEDFRREMIENSKK